MLPASSSSEGYIGRKDVWASYWLVTAILLPFVAAFVTLFWFGIGGTMDLRTLFVMLSHAKRDSRDDGTVSHLSVTPPDISDEL